MKKILYNIQYDGNLTTLHETGEKTPLMGIQSSPTPSVISELIHFLDDYVWQEANK